MVRRAWQDAGPWHDPVPAAGALPSRRAATAVAGPSRALRRADLRAVSGASRSSHRRSPKRSIRSGEPARRLRPGPWPTASSSAVPPLSQLIKVHPRKQPGHRSTDPADLPSEQTTYFDGGDIAHLQRLAAGHGEAIGILAMQPVLDTPLPWTKMPPGLRRCWGLVKKWGPDKVDEPPGYDGVDAKKRSTSGLIGRMLERATENAGVCSAPPVTTRFARDPGEFTTDAAKGSRSA